MRRVRDLKNRVSPSNREIVTHRQCKPLPIPSVRSYPHPLIPSSPLPDMDFDFLPNLPKSNLDDRDFNDLMQECLLRIPRYCPEWTHHNPSDPGITVLELFAWLTDQMLMRFNQVPRRNYVAFLELLGIRLQPPTPARTELTFYLSRERPSAYTIEAGTEVATERTETEEAIVFSTSEDLVIGNPRIVHFFTTPEGDDPETRPLDTRILGGDWLEQGRSWRQDESGSWGNGGEATELFVDARQGSCFYFVLDHYSEEAEGSENREGEPLRGNVIAINFRGEPAGGTGSSPDNPPRRWQAWGEENQCWRDILNREADDRTDGFNFDRTPEQGADVVLHLPVTCKPVDFNTPYRGYWIRCVHEVRQSGTYLYMRSPRINGLGVRSIGGTVTASQCAWIRQPELLGISDGKPGQRFPLQYRPVLHRNDREYVAVCPPGTALRDLADYRWQEVGDFSDSTATANHYVIDDRNGVVQFGPIVLEPGELQRQSRDRARSQPHDRYANGRVRDLDRFLPNSATETNGRAGERQYGKIPPKGHEIYMTGYRWGGGEQGNVKAGTLTKLMVAQAYIKGAINYKGAIGGTQAESLESAVMRVPAWLRTRERAVTREDFEYLVRQSSAVAVSRVRCLDAVETGIPGQVNLLVVPQVPLPTELVRGMAPERFALDKQFRDRLKAYLDERKLLGVNVQVDSPEFVGVKVRLEVVLKPQYAESIRLQERTQQEVQSVLYRFLNPVTGGFEGTGWAFGAPVHRFEIADRAQQVAGVSSVVGVRLLRFRKSGDDWICDETVEDLLKLDRHQIVCSWANRPPREARAIASETRFTDHDIYFLNGFEQYLPPER
ncbi:putative baseplate assembly protein [Baaleninema sp.]|uniref:putative baseplate assembly protein n=1 Tax=Baaleninema sp. TaxID=3101197 RepID=UPI003D07ADEF